MYPVHWEYQVERYRCRGGKPRLRSVGGSEVHNDGEIHGPHRFRAKRRLPW